MKKMFKSATVIILAIAITTTLANCKPVAKNGQLTKSKSASIINGTPVTADIQLAKSVVGLMMNYEISAGEKVWLQGCTGSVLNQKFILTAAHCLNSSKPEDLAINFSLTSVVYEKQLYPKTRINDIENVFVIRKVKSFIQHPKYNGSGDNDLALILLETEIPADAVPVQILPDQFLNIADNKTTFDQKTVEVILMGFGLVSEDPQTDSEVLRMTAVPATFENHFVVTDQTKGSGGCNGDSGGPAFYTFEGTTYQVGVTHGPHNQSTTCHEQGQWVNPALNKEFLTLGQEKLLAEAATQK